MDFNQWTTLVGIIGLIITFVGAGFFIYYSPQIFYRVFFGIKFKDQKELFNENETGICKQ